MRFCSVVTAAGWVMTAAACHDFTGSPQLSAGQESPSHYSTPAGARLQAKGALAHLSNAVGKELGVLEIITDEMTGISTSVDGPLVANGGERAIDQRVNDDHLMEGDLADIAFPYDAIQLARQQAHLAHGALLRYDSAASHQLAAETYAAEGYDELLLADAFCSGVPLSTIDFAGDFTLRAGSTTSEVYTSAAALFDTASHLIGTAGSPRADSVAAFARVGWGRALLALGAFDSAAHVVAAIPTSSAYAVRTVSGYNFFMADREGGTGLAYVTGGDPRIDVQTVIQYNASYPFIGHSPAKYVTAQAHDSIAVIIASGVEARLIEAEAALRRGNVTGWLAILNTLRTTGDFTVTGADTAWTAGTGGIAGLRKLDDPGIGFSESAATDARVTLQFNERALWLYMTGHRQGDLRRLIRQYGRAPNRVYPSGAYPLGGSYEGMVTIPIPSTEKANPYFEGCLSRGA